MSKSKILNPKSQIETWPDADRAMEELAKLDAQRREVAARRDAKAAEVESKFNAELCALSDAHDAIERSLKAFAGKRKAEFKPAPSGDGRSYEHAGVSFGYRRTPPSVYVEDEAATIAWAETSKYPELIRTKVEINREYARAVIQESERDAERLAAHGISLKSKDKFFCEIDTRQ